MYNIQIKLVTKKSGDLVCKTSIWTLLSGKAVRSNKVWRRREIGGSMCPTGWRWGGQNLRPPKLTTHVTVDQTIMWQSYLCMCTLYILSNVDTSKQCNRLLSAINPATSNRHIHICNVSIKVLLYCTTEGWDGAAAPCNDVQRYIMK